MKWIWDSCALCDMNEIIYVHFGIGCYMKINE